MVAKKAITAILISLFIKTFRVANGWLLFSNIILYLSLNYMRQTYGKSG